MADLDSSLPLKRIGTTALAISDNTGGTPLSVSGIFEGGISFTIAGRGVVEVTTQGRHTSTPTVVETTDGVSTIEIEGAITSFKGSSNVHMYELLTRTGTAAASVTHGDGDAVLLEIVLTFIQATQSSPPTQTMTFAYCHCDSLEITASTEDVVRFKASFTNYENVPTAA